MTDREVFLRACVELLLAELAAQAVDPLAEPLHAGGRVVSSARFRELEARYGQRQVTEWMRSAQADVLRLVREHDWLTSAPN